MPAVEPFCKLLGVSPNKLMKNEIFIIEADLFINIYSELRIILRNKLTDYIEADVNAENEENTMLDNNFIRLILQDILSTEEYTLEGIARYIGIREDILKDIFIRPNISDTLTPLRKIIELHRSIRIDLYNSIMKKIALKLRLIT